MMRKLHVPDMRYLLPSYDAYLRRQARQGVQKRMRALQGLLAPWGIGSLVVAIGSRALGQPLLLVLWAPFLGGCWWVLHRFHKYAGEFDRTPAPAPWLQTEHGQALVRALDRVTLSALSGVTLQTKLRADLKLTERDRFELAKILAAPGHMDALAGRLGQDTDVTVGELLDAVASQPFAQSRPSAAN